MCSILSYILSIFTAACIIVPSSIEPIEVITNYIYSAISNEEIVSNQSSCCALYVHSQFRKLLQYFNNQMW